MQRLSEATAIRLYNSITVNNSTASPSVLPPIKSDINNECKSLNDTNSSNELGNSCRICRWNRSDMQVLQCPCLCKGSVGYIHLACLKRWIQHRRDKRCEICNTLFDIPDEKIYFCRMIRSFFSSRCCGVIAKQLLYSASLAPVAHIVLQQVIICVETVNHSPNDQLTVQEVAVASCALLTTSTLFFHFFEFVTTRFLIIRNILHQWWMYGNTTDFNPVDIESEVFGVF